MLEPEVNGSADLAEREFGARPDDEFGTEPRQVGRTDRRCGKVVEHEVPVRGAVEGIRRDVVETEVRGDGAAVDLPVDPGERTGAERHDGGGLAGRPKAFVVTGKHPEVGEQVVAEIYRLGPLEVGVPRHRPSVVDLCETQQLTHQAASRSWVIARSRGSSPPYDVGRDLVVPGTARMKLAGQRSPTRSPRRRSTPCARLRRPAGIRSRRSRLIRGTDLRERVVDRPISSSR